MQDFDDDFVIDPYEALYEVAGDYDDDADWEDDEEDIECWVCGGVCTYGDDDEDDEE